MGKKSGWSHGVIHRPTCRLERALTLRFVALAVHSLSRATVWNGSILQARTDRNMLVSVPYHASSGVTLSNFGYTSVTCATWSGTDELATQRMS